MFLISGAIEMDHPQVLSQLISQKCFFKTF
jgi:hypothetical protein